MNTSDRILDFLKELQILKITKRTGWQWRGIRDCESIADHCFRVIALAMVLGDHLTARGQKLDMLKLIRMAVLHELSETRVGDIPYPALKYLGKDTKNRAESEAFADIVSGLDGRDEYKILFEEYEAEGSPEARIVKASDKLEMMLQCLEYEKSGHRGLDDYWENNDTDRQIAVDEVFSGIYEKLIEEHRELTSGKK